MSKPSKSAWRPRAELAIGLWATLLALGACGAEPRPPALGPAPSLAQPSDAIPGDLDLVLRLDLGRMRQVLGADAVRNLRRRSGVGAASADDEALIGDSLERAETAWLALRLAERRELVDSVLIVRGNFREMDIVKYQADPAWGGEQDLGGGWRMYERTPKQRAAAARVYARLDEILVFVTAAEIDGVERVLERGVRDAHPTPPERGIVSVAARPRAFSAGLRQRAPAAARFLAKSENLEASADVLGDRLKIELSMTMDSEESARRAADAAGLLALELIEQRSIPESIAKSLSIEAVGTSVVLHVDTPLELLTLAAP